MSDYEQETGEGEGSEYGSDTGTETTFDDGGWDTRPGETVYDWSWETAGFDNVLEYDAVALDGGVVEFEWISGPAIEGDAITFSYKTKDRKTATEGAVVAHNALLQNRNIIGTSTTKLKQPLGPNDTGVGGIRPLSSGIGDGDYEFSISISGVARNIAFRIHAGAISAI